MHHEVLTPEAAKLFPSLRHFAGFDLAGGTALALQIGHRVSVDFDLFSPKRIPSSLLDRVRSVFGRRHVAVSVNRPEELTVFVNGVKMTFLTYPFPKLFNVVSLEGTRAYSVKEIAATKAYTVGRRGSLKDYVDLFFILMEKHATLKSILASAKKKYGHEFNDRLFLEQLLYLNDLEEGGITFLHNNSVTKQKLRHFFSEQVRALEVNGSR